MSAYQGLRLTVTAVPTSHRLVKIHFWLVKIVKHWSARQKRKTEII